MLSKITIIGQEASAVIRAVDNMKESRDQANPDQLSIEQKAYTCNLIASMHTTHIAIATQYDYPVAMKEWIDEVRATGNKVWFRCNWNNSICHHGFDPLNPHQPLRLSLRYLHNKAFSPLLCN
jgi:hypothetical protein